MTTPPAGAPQDALEMAAEDFLIEKKVGGSFNKQIRTEAFLAGARWSLSRQAEALLKLQAVRARHCGTDEHGMKLFAYDTLEMLDAALTLLSAPKAQEKKE